MTIRTFVPLATVALALTMPSVANAEITPLKIGDTAPAIEVSHWLKGKELAAFEAGNVYVLEFWATWCGPCRASIPHLTELQEKYADYDVTIIGVSDEQLQDVVKFVAKTNKDDDLWNDLVGYTLATDPDKSVVKTYLHGVGARGIPTSFIIGKDLKIEWVGHPLDLDEPLEAIVKGTWDRNAFAAEFEPTAKENRKELKKQLELVAKAEVYQEQLEAAKKSGDTAAAVKALDAIVALDDANLGSKISKFEFLLKELKEPAKAYSYGRDLAVKYPEDAMLFNALAWITVDEPGIETRDFDFALELAKKANELTDGESPYILDTLARVYYEKGDLRKAIQIQTDAVEFAQDTPMAGELTSVLEKYETELAGKGNR